MLHRKKRCFLSKASSLILLSLPVKSVVNVVCLFLVGELVEGVDNLTVVPLSVVDRIGCTHNGYVKLSVTSANVVPVDEVNVSELTAVKNAVLDGHGLASAEEAGTKVTVGVHRGEVTGFVYESTELSVDRAGMTVVTLISVVGNHLSHDVEKVVLEILEIERINVVRALLNHYRAGGVVRSDTNGTVLNAGLLNDLDDLACYVVEGGDPASGLELKLFLINLKFHFCFPPKKYYFLLRRSPTAPPGWISANCSFL